MREFGILILAFAMLGLIGLGLMAKVDVWRECRKDHSVLYCHHLVSK